MRNRTSISRLLILLTLASALTLALAACSTGGADSNDRATTDRSDAAEFWELETGVQISDDAPDPLPISASDLRLIELWRAAGVPQYRDSEVLDFDPHTTQIENGGVLLLGIDGTSEEVIGFYRGALAVLGWEEQRVTANEITAQTDQASLFMTVNENESGRYVLMILTDRL